MPLTARNTISSRLGKTCAHGFLRTIKLTGSRWRVTTTKIKTMSDEKTQIGQTAPAVGVQRLVRLAAPLSGRYCNFDAGTEVKIKESLTGQWTVERVTWRNSLTISNVLCGVPSHALILAEPNVLAHPLGVAAGNIIEAKEGSSHE